MAGQVNLGRRVLSLKSGSDLIKGNPRAMAGERPYNRLLYWLLRPVIKDEIRWQLKKLTGWEQIAELPYFQQRELLKTDLASSEAFPWYFKLTGFQDGGAYGTVFLKNGQLEAIMLANRTGLACRLYKSRTGLPGESRGARSGPPERGPRRPVHGQALRLSA